MANATITDSNGKKHLCVSNGDDKQTDKEYSNELNSVAGSVGCSGKWIKQDHVVVIEPGDTTGQRTGNKETTHPNSIDKSYQFYFH